MWKLVLIVLCAKNVYLQDYDVLELEEIKLQIVGIFGLGAEVQEQAFNECMRSANVEGIKFDPLTLKLYRNDSYSIWRTFCKSSEEIKFNPIAVIGPQYRISDSAIIDQCTSMHIPHIQATWQSVEPEEQIPDVDLDNVFNKSISLNFFPSANDLSVAYAHLLKYYNWKKFAVLYEDDFGLMRVQKILSEHTDEYLITMRRLDPTGDNKNIFKDLIKNQDSRILLDCDVDNLLKYMHEATTMNMTNNYQHYILTSLDSAVLLDKLEVLSSNVSWLSITNADELLDPQHFLATRVGNWVHRGGAAKDYPLVTKMKLETLLMEDIAKHLMNAVQLIDLQNLKSIEPPLPCGDSSVTWQLGGELLQYLMQNQTSGVTGNIQFDPIGQRVNYTLHVNEINLQKRYTIGRWESATLGPITEDRPASQNNLTQTTSKHFIIVSRLAKPYLSYVDETEEYEGFAYDLVKEIFQELKDMGFNYTFSFAKDLKGKTHGKIDPTTKKWDGLIGDLLTLKADLAVADLTITEERKKVVDFSVPFMSLGISILYKKEPEVQPDTFSFLHPYSFEVWMYTATAYCVVSIILFVCSRISPADWENPQPCDKDPEELENIWNFKNCTWLTMGSIMTQGCDILPKAIGTRWVCGLWWFFAMIVCQTYIAQLAASLTSAMEDEPINSVEDLAKQSKVSYGMLKGGSTYQFFQNSKDKMYKKMFENMEANPAVYAETNEQGEQFVLKGTRGFAFFMESSTIEYKIKRECQLKKVGGELDSKEYGVAMPSNSPFRSQINRAILELKQKTRIEAIKERWWEQEFGAKTCQEETTKGDVEGDLEIENLVGAFLVLIVGLVFSVLIAFVEFMNEVRNIAIREQVTHKEAFIKELKACLDFTKNQKAVLRNPSRAPSVANSIKNADRLASRAASVAAFINLEKNA